MFYSQFILAKKGPLGTIWIAAHLERKLRKNQVADTDIGVSVDSILFPDVPIALRLTSHLLLGVVRIYSRKVNYLFDDCSETLLKVKQAFRSAAVDLPPEESKAPYHSITLPETFDLDDFELPDNDIFQGNFVDHHISSREQITLQDSMAGVTYSTSKFGLDERFGDGDASGLDLDEELFLEKIGTAAGHASKRSDPQSSVRPMTPLKQDEHPETRVGSVDDYADLMDYEHAPCTPGLLEETNLSNVQEASACDDHLESEYHLGESTVNENKKHKIFEDKQEVYWSSCNDANSDAIPMVVPEECGHQSGGLHSSFSKPQGDYPLEPAIGNVQVESSSGSKPLSDLLGPVKPLDPASEVTCTEDLQSVDAKIDNNPSLEFDKPNDHHQGPYGPGLEKSAFEISGLTSTFHELSEGVPTDQGSPGIEVPGTVEIGSGWETQLPDKSGSPLKNQDGFFSLNPEAQARQEPADTSSLNLDIYENGAPSETVFLRPCNSNMEVPDMNCGVGMSTDAGIQFDVTDLTTSEREETVMIGKGCSGTHNSEENWKENHVQQLTLQEEIHALFSEPDNQVMDASANERLMVNLNNSAEADLPAPEKLLSVPEDLVGQHNNMLPEATPGVFVGHDEGDAGSKFISGKKRSFIESTLTEQSLNSVESSRLVRFKSTIESVPDDDDLLSSILVGRSSVFKVKPTPRRSEVTSAKRTRTTPRSGAPKRKVLMDDTMVLHGDMIRQQLTSTEDIRRARRKAPCTCAEISMIQNQQLEDGIFLKPLFIGMSIELISLHSQMRDLRGITVCKNDPAGASLEINADLRPPSNNIPSIDDMYASFDTMAETMLSSHDVRIDGSLPSAAEPYVSSQNMENAENLNMGDDKGSEEPNVAEQSEVSISEPLLLNRDHEAAKSSGVNIIINDDEEQTKPTRYVGPMNDKNDDASSPVSVVEMNPITETSGRNTSLNDDMLAGLPDQEQNAPSTELDYALRDVDSGQAISRDELAAENGDIDARFETDQEKNAPSVDFDLAVTAVDNGQVISRDDIDTMFETDQEKNATSIEFDYAVTDANNGQASCRDELAAKDGGLDAMFETNPAVRDDDPSEMVRDGASFELLLNSKQGGLEYDERNEIHSAVFGENIVDSSYPAHGGMHYNGFMDIGASAAQPEAYQSYMMEADGSRFDLHDREDMDYTAAGNDTEFLNVDDDDLAEMDDEHIHDDEEARFAENTGWSSRTRAVSKYLQTLFNKEAEFGRRSLSMDSLLVGKTRKEASRMFFEALVLKTRDYIHVEQPNAFDGVTIKPRTRLMKPDF